MQFKNMKLFAFHLYFVATIITVTEYRLRKNIFRSLSFHSIVSIPYMYFFHPCLFVVRMFISYSNWRESQIIYILILTNPLYYV